MLFMYIHTHTPERCMINKQEELSKMYADGLAAAKKAGIKVVATYSAPHQHTMFVVYDANDLMTLERVLAPLTLWGDGELIPVVSAEQMMPPSK